MDRNIIFTSSGVISTKFSDDFIKQKIVNKTIIVVDNGTYGTTNYEAREESVKKFLEYGANKVDLVTIDKENTESILKYDVCYVMGGSIANLVELVSNTDFKQVIEEFLEYGIYIGQSAGSIILNADVEWYFDIKRGTKPKYDVTFPSYPGLGLVKPLIYPHFNREDELGVSKIKRYEKEIKPLNDEEYLEFSSREVTVEMACSINGFIADEKGEEEFLSYRGWEIMLELLTEYDVLIWGRTTFENVISWGEKYKEDLKRYSIIVLSKNGKNTTSLSNVSYCSSIEECLKVCKQKQYRKLFISGGAKTNNEFLSKDIVDHIIVNYNPVLITKGIGLFDGNKIEKRLELVKVVQEKEGIVQVHYKVK